MLSEKSEKAAEVGAIENIHEEQDLKNDLLIGTTLPISLQSKTAEELASFKRNLVRKIDLRLMPMLIAIFLLK